MIESIIVRHVITGAEVDSAADRGQNIIAACANALMIKICDEMLEKHGGSPGPSDVDFIVTIEARHRQKGMPT